MKKVSACCLSLLLLLALLFSGCKQEPELTTNPPESREASVPPASPAEYRNPFSTTPPEGDVVVLNLCFGQDIWPDYSYDPTLVLRVLSKHALDTTRFSVSLPIQTGYEAEVHPVTVYPKPQNPDESGLQYPFPYYLYQIYRGLDWGRLAELERAARENPSAENTQALQSYGEQFRSDYTALTARELPLFFLYQVEISFPTSAAGNPLYDEECDRIELRLGDFETVLEGGSFSIHAESLPLEPLPEDEQPGLSLNSYAGLTGAVSFPWNDGIERLEGLMELEAMKDVVLTDFSFCKSRIEILQLHLTIASENGASMDFFWDGKTPVKLKTGDRLTIDTVFRDPLAANHTVDTAEGPAVSSNYDYAARIYPILRYTCEGDPCTAWAEYNLTRYPDPWESYAVWFDGLDISGYYMDYYQPIVNAWRSEFEGAKP